MRPFQTTISLDEARRRLTQTVRPIARVERVNIDGASCRVAAVDVTSTINVPPFSRSAMDGYAVRAVDVTKASAAAPARLTIVERVFTGAVPTRRIEPGTCAEIATGAPLPAGADAVIMVEETEQIDDAHVALRSTAVAGQNVSPCGADIAAGATVVRAGDYLTPARVGALAAIGCGEVQVFARPRVTILSTGNEVVDPGRPLAPGQIYDVNRFTLAAIVAAHGGVVETHHPAEDTHAALDAALDGCTDADMIVFSGGSSVGDRDLVSDLVARRGEMIFHGVAIKPGKPTALAVVDGKPFFGMPGNPTSCLSNAYILLIPFLRATARLPPWRPTVVRAPLARSIASTANRHQFYTVKLRDEIVWPAFKGSGDITSLSEADGYLEIPADVAGVDEGSLVDVTLF